MKCHFSLGSTLASSTPFSPFCDQFPLLAFPARYWLSWYLFVSRSHRGCAGSKCDVNRLLFTDWLWTWSAICQWHEKVLAEVAERIYYDKPHILPHTIVLGKARKTQQQLLKYCGKPYGCD
ncbi:hypothetical protein GOODEAATRI_003223 [Goodea atripinnis]|uniref:Uncharacterized protein n=1 Tax=Goodea atripinnis TaxID=208336 RepID=A0ABV0NH41_9TELE